MPLFVVFDASAMIELLVGPKESARRLTEYLAADIHVPHLHGVEVMSVLRGHERGRRITEVQAEAAWQTFLDIDPVRHEFEPTAQRVWELRHQFTSYDASYLALAEALGAPLVTCDRKLAGDGHSASIHLITDQ